MVRVYTTRAVAVPLEDFDIREFAGTGAFPDRNAKSVALPEVVAGTSVGILPRVVVEKMKNGILNVYRMSYRGGEAKAEFVGSLRTGSREAVPLKGLLKAPENRAQGQREGLYVAAGVFLVVPQNNRHVSLVLCPSRVDLPALWVPADQAVGHIRFLAVILPAGSNKVLTVPMALGRNALQLEAYQREIENLPRHCLSRLEEAKSMLNAPYSPATSSGRYLGLIRELRGMAISAVDLLRERTSLSVVSLEAKVEAEARRIAKEMLT